MKLSPCPFSHVSINTHAHIFIFIPKPMRGFMKQSSWLAQWILCVVGPLFFCGHMGLIALVHLPVARRLDAPLIRTKKERAESRMHVPQILGQFADFYLLFFFIHCYQCFIGVETLVIRRRASIDYIYRVKKS